ncbi:anti-sigma factor domain-containing protein [Vulcanococcus limneticus]|uniref:anti-sigma factor domain-containing protein n=1 Tax=Vulcanococcus limneticus TaxID=2170428 RepID=UPI00398BD8E6
MTADAPLPQDQIDALLAGHALGDLDSAEREQLAALLRKDPALRQRLEEFRTTLELLPLALPATVKPPPRLRQRLLSRSDAAGPRPREARRAAAAGWLVPGLMGAALLVLGVQLQQTRQQVAQLQQQLPPGPSAGGLPVLNRRLPLRALESSGRASGEVLVTGNPSHNLLVLDGLPPLPPGQTYRLWAQVNGRAVGCVPFAPDRNGHVAMPIPASPTSQASSVSVSLETVPDGSAPRGPMLLSGAI